MKTGKLSVRLSVYIMILIIFCTYGVTFLSYNQLATLSKSIAQAQLEKQTELLAITLASPVWTFNSEAIKSTGESLLQENEDIHVMGIQILDFEKKELYFGRRKLDPEKLIDSYPKLSQKIVYNNENIGELTVWADPSPLNSRFFKIIKFTTAIIFIAGTIVSFSVYFALARMLAKPLKTIKKAATALLAGDFRTRIDENLDYEFLLLARAYNQMFDEIERRDKELRHYNENLEKLVEERTKESDFQKSLLVQASKMATLGEFAGNVAHEINNPLSVIQGNAQIIGKALNDNNTEKIEKSKDKIIAMVDRISKIINGLRSFARDGSKDEMKPFEMKKLFEAIHDLSARRLQANNIELKFDCKSSDKYILGREIQISQVLMNLINNSSDAIQELKEKWIEISCYNVDSNLFITVADSGPGIPKNIQDKMMNPFYTSKEIGKGTGLGLSISMGIINDHNGELYYVQESKNTKFCIKIHRYIELKEAI